MSTGVSELFEHHAIVAHSQSIQSVVAPLQLLDPFSIRDGLTCEAGAIGENLFGDPQEETIESRWTCSDRRPDRSCRAALLLRVRRLVVRQAHGPSGLVSLRPASIFFRRVGL